MSGWVVWITGLPASGKSTLAGAVVAALRSRGLQSCLLDSDIVRDRLFPQQAYDAASRRCFYKSLANLAAMLADGGLIAVVAATANSAEHRRHARDAAPTFLEVYVATPAAECALRDPKGLYRAASEGRIADLPGAGAPYDVPVAPDVIADGGRDEASVLAIVRAVSPAEQPD